MKLHELWLLLLVLLQVGDYINVLLLILCHFLVEHEGVRIVSFIFIISLFVITKYVVTPVSTIALCEDGVYQIGCCKTSLALF